MVNFNNDFASSTNHALYHGWSDQNASYVPACVTVSLTVAILSLGIQQVHSYMLISWSSLLQYRLFACFILLPLQQRFSVQLRKIVWKEHPTVIRILSLPIVEASLLSTFKCHRSTYRFQLIQRIIFIPLKVMSQC